MGSKRNKDLKRQWEMGKLGRRPEESHAPLPDAEMSLLTAHLGAVLPQHGCDDTAKLTIAWLNTRSHPTEPVLSWLKERGGFCDCEILANALESWTDE